MIVKQYSIMNTQVISVTVKWRDKNWRLMRVAGYLRHDSMWTDANESMHATHSSVLLSFFLSFFPFPLCIVTQRKAGWLQIYELWPLKAMQEINKPLAWCSFPNCIFRIAVCKQICQKYCAYIIKCTCGGLQLLTLSVGDNEKYLPSIYRSLLRPHIN